MRNSDAVRVALIAASLCVTIPASSEVIAPLPAQATTMQVKVMPRLTPSARGWVQSEAKTILRQNLASPDAMIATARKDASARFAGQDTASADIETMVTLVMMEVAAEARRELRGQMASVQAANAKKRTQSAPADPPRQDKGSPGDMGHQQQSMLQSYMDQKSKADEALAHVMKKKHDTQGTAISNLK